MKQTVQPAAILISASLLMFSCKRFDKDKNYAAGAKDFISNASSVLENKKIKYGPGNLIDGAWASWCEGKQDDGIGESLTLTFNKKSSKIKGKQLPYVESLTIKNGFGWDKYFKENNRPKEIEITSGQFSQKYTLPDSMEPFKISFEKHLLVNQNSINIKILSIYRGSKYRDTCISEIAVNDTGLDFFSKDRDEWNPQKYRYSGGRWVNNSDGNYSKIVRKFFITKDTLPMDLLVFYGDLTIVNGLPCGYEQLCDGTHEGKCVKFEDEYHCVLTENCETGKMSGCSPENIPFYLTFENGKPYIEVGDHREELAEYF